MWNKQAKKVPTPDYPPPNGYCCHRCGVKGHWIQECPTNDDPDHVKPKIKKTTGIPRSRLVEIDAPEEGFDESRAVMMNSDGKYVMAVPDEETWKKYQATQQKAADQVKEEAKGNKELQELGLECDIDRKLFDNPHKTPCCGKTYCFNCIENALLDHDLICPNCKTEDVLIDELEPDEEVNKKITAYHRDKRLQKDRPHSPKNAEAASIPAAETNTTNEDPVRSGQLASPAKSPHSVASTESKKRKAENDSNDAVSEAKKLKVEDGAANPEGSRAASAAPSDTSSGSKKRKAEDNPDTDNAAKRTKSASVDGEQQKPVKLPPSAPKSMRKEQEEREKAANAPLNIPKNAEDFAAYMNSLAAQNGYTPQQAQQQFMQGGFGNGMNGMGNGMMMNGLGGMGGQMNPMMMNGMMRNMGNGGFNQMQQMGGYGMNGGMGFNMNRNYGYGQNNMGFNNQQGNQFNNGNFGYQNQNQNQSFGRGFNINRGNFNGGGIPTGPKAGNFGNQTPMSEEESPYMRQPVNPMRHQYRNNRVRPTDFKELGGQ